MAFAQIEVTFAGTLLQITRVERGARCDVEGTTIDTRVEQVVEIGLVRVAVTHVQAVAPLAGRGIEKRPLPFLAGSLAVHVAIALFAMARVPLEPVGIAVDITSPERLPPRIARIEATPEPKPAATTGGKSSTAPQEVAVGSSPASLQEAFGKLDDLSAITGTVDLAEALSDVGPIYNPDVPPVGSFGTGGTSFDVADRPEFETVKTGRYATVATGRGAGAGYKLPGEVGRPPLMALACDDASCVVEGKFDRFEVRDIIEKRYVDLVKCYERTAKTIREVEITLRFDIDPGGVPGEIAVDGHEAVGNCVKRIVARTKFPPRDQPTHVKTYPMAFWRT